jgi:hypothetical protein
LSREEGPAITGVGHDEGEQDEVNMGKRHFDGEPKAGFHHG